MNNMSGNVSLPVKFQPLVKMGVAEGFLSEILDSRILSSESGVDTYENDTVKSLTKQEGIPLLYILGLCVHTTDRSLLLWFLSSVNTSTIFVLLTFIVYSVIPELKNLHGSIFRCYLASYICCMILFTIFIVSDLNQHATSSMVVVLSSTVGFTYFGIALMLWLNVMSFNIWRTFRQLRPSWETNNLNVQKRQQRKFFFYSCYAWGGPVVIILLVTSSAMYLKDFESTIPKIFWLYVPILPIASIAICNTCLYISTALTIKQRKKELAQMIDSMNKHHEENKEWFNLYVKLFVIMGGPLIFWAAGIYLKSETFWKIVYALEAMQGIAIFLIFVWKDNVKRSFSKRYDGSMHRLGSFFRCGSNPQPEIGKFQHHTNVFKPLAQPRSGIAMSIAEPRSKLGNSTGQISKR